MTGNQTESEKGITLTTTNQNQSAAARMQAATDEVRAANHASYDSSRDPEGLHRRIGAMVELLGYLEQQLLSLETATRNLPTTADKENALIRHGSGQAYNPGDLISQGSGALSNARAKLRDVSQHVNNAWANVGRVHFVPRGPGRV
jgi:hypothetical protein